MQIGGPLYQAILSTQSQPARSLSTSGVANTYQNTSDLPKLVVVDVTLGASGAMRLKVSATSRPATTVCGNFTLNTRNVIAGIVPPSYYYEFFDDGGATPTLNIVTEYD